MKTNRKQDALDALKDRILNLDLAPGQVLDEQDLCDQYGLSRTPLREVLQRLAGEGYVSLASHRSASVSPMDLGTMRHFFQSAPMIYAAVARLAAEQSTAAQIDQLKRCQHAFRCAVDSRMARDMALCNHRFHATLGDMAGSPYLQPSLERLLIDHTRMSHRFYRVPEGDSTDHIHLAADQHDAMIEAIAAHQAATAVSLTLQHWELSRNELDKYVFPDPLPIDPLATSMASEH